MNHFEAKIFFNINVQKIYYWPYDHVQDICRRCFQRFSLRCKKIMTVRYIGQNIVEKSWPPLTPLRGSQQLQRNFNPILRDLLTLMLKAWLKLSYSSTGEMYLNTPLNQSQSQGIYLHWDWFQGGCLNTSPRYLNFHVKVYFTNYKLVYSIK